MHINIQIYIRVCLNTSRHTCKHTYKHVNNVSKPCFDDCYNSIHHNISFVHILFPGRHLIGRWRGSALCGSCRSQKIFPDRHSPRGLVGPPENACIFAMRQSHKGVFGHDECPPFGHWEERSGRSVSWPIDSVLQSSGSSTAAQVVVLCPQSSWASHRTSSANTNASIRWFMEKKQQNKWKMTQKGLAKFKIRQFQV